MINAEFIKITRCISCGYSGLFFSPQKDNFRCDNCKREYPVSDNVPVFLPEKETDDLLKTGIHEKLDTEFHYIDHYQKDAFETDYFAERDKGTEHSDGRVQEYIVSQISAKKGRILDVGCGKAWAAKLFCPRGFEVVSMDISHKNTATALKKYPFDNHTAVVADAFSLPFQKNSFDYIIASEIIEHVSSPALFVERLFASLKPGGKLIVTTPYKEKIKYSLCIHCNKPTPMHAHLHSFDEKILLNLYQSPELKSVKHTVFNNKIPVHLRLHILFQHFGFRMWKALDKLLNSLYNLPTRILVVWEKKQDSISKSG